MRAMSILVIGLLWSSFIAREGFNHLNASELTVSGGIQGAQKKPSMSATPNPCQSTVQPSLFPHHATMRSELSAKRPSSP